jgi:hypothetical protein
MGAIDVDEDGNRLLVVKPCLMDLVNEGWMKLDKVNIRKV